MFRTLVAAYIGALPGLLLIFLGQQLGGICVAVGGAYAISAYRAGLPKGKLPAAPRSRFELLLLGAAIGLVVSGMIMPEEPAAAVPVIAVAMSLGALGGIIRWSSRGLQDQWDETSADAPASSSSAPLVGRGVLGALLLHLIIVAPIRRFLDEQERAAQLAKEEQRVTQSLEGLGQAIKSAQKAQELIARSHFREELRQRLISGEIEFETARREAEAFMKTATDESEPER